jgi:type IV pilus assembly protein PilE
MTEIVAKDSLLLDGKSIRLNKSCASTSSARGSCMKTVPSHRAVEGGFTLIELMVVVVIIAILSAIAVPLYNDYVTRSKLTEAYNSLAAYRVSMEQYYQDNRQYNNGAICGADPAVASSGLKYFTMACAPASAGSSGSQAYVAEADGNAGTPTGLFKFTVDNTNVQTTKASPGWGTSTTCWIKRKGGGCQ